MLTTCYIKNYFYVQIHTVVTLYNIDYRHRDMSGLYLKSQLLHSKAPKLYLNYGGGGSLKIVQVFLVSLNIKNYNVL